MFIDRLDVPAPDIDFAGPWLNARPPALRALRGKVTLVDFWDYTCINCLRTLPYLREWHRRYAPRGLVVIGVHAPEFPFGRDAANVEYAVREHQIEYPVVLDNDLGIWREFKNQYWPSRYLIDGAGRWRYQHHGEGNYVETELAIQSLLCELDPSVELPDLMRPIRDLDYPGSFCYAVTPEIHLRAPRGNIANANPEAQGVAADYRLPDAMAEDVAYLRGRWIVGEENVEYGGDPDQVGEIRVQYSAADVNLVLAPRASTKRGRSGRPVEIEIVEDGTPLGDEERGRDVALVHGRSILRVDRPRMYHLVRNPGVASADLSVRVRSAGVSFYAFTFTTCKVRPDDVRPREVA